jgi:hypothetical protein
MGLATAVYVRGYRFGCIGDGFGDLGAGADLRGVVSRIEPDECFVAHTASVMDVHIKIPAKTQVILARVVTAPRGPKAAWLTPPNAAVMSTFSPPWIKTTTINSMLIRMCIAMIAAINLPPPSHYPQLEPSRAPNDPARHAKQGVGY